MHIGGGDFEIGHFRNCQASRLLKKSGLDASDPKSYRSVSNLSLPIVGFTVRRLQWRRCSMTSCWRLMMGKFLPFACSISQQHSTLWITTSCYWNLNVGLAYGALYWSGSILISVAGRSMWSTLCLKKRAQLWNGIARNYMDRFWWYLAEIFKSL